MSRTFFRLLLAAFVSGTWLSAQQPAQPDYTLKVDVPFAFVDVTVQDSAGNAINNLPQDAFELYENGARQQIRYFSPVSAPYDILLLFDRSGSTQDKWLLMQRAVAGFIANLRPQDRIAIATFDSELEKQLNWTTDRQKALLALPQLIHAQKIGGTDFYGALEQSLRHEFGKPAGAGRRALVVMTDGRDTSIYKELMLHNHLLDPDEDRRYQRILRTTRAQRIPIYVIAFNTDRNLEPNTLGADEYLRLQKIFPASSVAERYLSGVRRRMEELAEVSAGRILYPERLDDIVPLYQHMGRELGTSYTLGYVSSNTEKDGSFRRIEVRANDAALHLTQSRPGYYAK
jgi:Ca-activated chloride channel family protein